MRPARADVLAGEPLVLAIGREAGAAVGMRPPFYS